MADNYSNQMKSRQNQKTLLKKLRLSIFGTIGFLVIVFVCIQFFAPQIGGLFGFISQNRNKELPHPELNLTPPTFQEVPEFTKKREINIEGYSNPGATVKLYLNGPEVAEALTGADSKFVFDNIGLIDGKNTVFARTVDASGNKSDKSQTLIVTLDVTGPKLEIQDPKNNDVIKNLDNRIPIRGKVNENAKVRINDKLAVLKPDMSFEFLLGVSKGDVTINIKATDDAGNETEKVLKVKYLKEQP